MGTKATGTGSKVPHSPLPPPTIYALSSNTPITRCNSRGHSTGESGDQKRSQLERLKHNARFASPWMEGREARREQRKRASKLHKLSDRPPARPPARRRPPDAATTAAGGERSRVLPQEEGGSDASNARPLLAAETPNDDDATRIAPAGNGKGGESLTLLNCS